MLQIPVIGIDVRYPHSRTMDRAPRAARPFLFAAKEILYRCTLPAPGPSPLPAHLPTPLLLVDDRASSGKTLLVALDLLAAAGILRSDVLVAVERCGRRAAHLVDVVLSPWEGGE